MSKRTWVARQSVFALGLLLLLLVLGLLGTLALTKHGRAETRRSYLRAAMSAAAGIFPEDVAALTGTPKDVGSPAFELVRKQLMRIHKANADSRFIYLMAVRNGQVVFLADAEPLSSPEASAPGDPYDEASPELRQAFVTGEPFTEGPIADRWGDWVTGFAPVKDEESGAVLAILGLDWDACEWRQCVGIYRWFALALLAFPVLLASAIFLGFVRVEGVNRMLAAEIEERSRVQRDLERLSKQDSLTGLANRRTFNMLLDVEWRRALRARLPLSLIMIDIDWFKNYNDHYGHPAGDEVLKRVAEAIRVAVKRVGDEPARYGGEEFVVILPGSDVEGALHVAEAVRANVEALAIPHAPGLSEPYVTVSLGLASSIPGTEDTPASFVNLADQALYQAKAAGRNCVEIHDTSK